MQGRVELKYLVTNEVKTRLLASWQEYLHAASHTDNRAVYPILSLYFDSPSLAFYYEKVDGEAVRNKVRLRGYGYGWRGMDPCFLEVKRKISSRILKFRKNLGSFQEKFLSPEQWEFDGAQGGQAAALSELYHLRPSSQVFYLREVYESPYSSYLRIVFDSLLVALHPKERLERHMLIEPQYQCLKDTQFILEIKCRGSLPHWIIEPIQVCQLEQQSISKYVLSVERLNLQNRETEVYSWMS